MTVDDRLRAAHARISEPHEATSARARALLLAAMAADAAPRAGTGTEISSDALAGASPQRGDRRGAGRPRLRRTSARGARPARPSSPS